MKMKKCSPALFPNSHEQHKGTCEFGLNGQRHVENVSDVDGLQALQAAGVLNVRRRIARCSRPPQMSIFRHAIDRPSEHIDIQLLKKQNNSTKTFDNTFTTKRGFKYELVQTHNR